MSHNHAYHTSSHIYHRTVKKMVGKKELIEYRINESREVEKVIACAIPIPKPMERFQQVQEFDEIISISYHH